MKSNFLQGLESDLKSLVRTKWPDCPNSNWSELGRRRRRRPDDPYTNDDVTNKWIIVPINLSVQKIMKIFKKVKRNLFIRSLKMVTSGHHGPSPSSAAREYRIKKLSSRTRMEWKIRKPKNLCRAFMNHSRCLREVRPSTVSYCMNHKVWFVDIVTT